MEIAEDDEGIRIKHVPVIKWIGGTLFYLGMLTSLYFLLFSSANVSPDAGTWGSLLFWILVVVAVTILLFDIGSGNLLLAPMVTVRIRPNEKYVEIAERRFYGNRVERHFFSQIVQFKSYRSVSNFSQQYFLALVRSNRKTLKLKLPLGLNKNETVRLIKKLNKLVRGK